MSYAYILSDAVPLASITPKAVLLTSNSTNEVPLDSTMSNAVPQASNVPEAVSLMHITLLDVPIASNTLMLCLLCLLRPMRCHQHAVDARGTPLDVLDMNGSAKSVIDIRGTPLAA